MTDFVYLTATTLDGYLADTDHSLSWLFAVEGSDTTDPEHADAFSTFADSVGAVVMGSSTYRWLLDETGVLDRPETWPEQVSGKPAFLFTHGAPRIPAGADITILSGDPADHLEQIAERAGGRDVWLMGGGDLVGQFADAGALDRIEATLAPVTLGAGAPLLPRRLGSDRLHLTDVERRGQFAHLTYAVTGPAT